MQSCKRPSCPSYEPRPGYLRGGETRHQKRHTTLCKCSPHQRKEATPSLPSPPPPHLPVPQTPSPSSGSATFASSSRTAPPSARTATLHVQQLLPSPCSPLHTSDLRLRLAHRRLRSAQPDLEVIITAHWMHKHRHFNCPHPTHQAAHATATKGAAPTHRSAAYPAGSAARSSSV
jgi:hypothetical protein